MSNSHILSERELAAKLGLSYWTVRAIRLKLGLPHFRTSGRIFYRLEAVQAWMAEQEKASSKIGNEEIGEYGTLRKAK